MVLSIVVTSRNDGHGGKLVERTNLFLHTTNQLFREVGIEAEIILVEWNPPSDKLLRGVLDVPEGLNLRAIIVPPEVHLELESGDLFPLYQMIAKNVGIRRAKGEWILATNPDLVYTPEIFERVAAGLCLGCVYRVPRIDVHTTELPPCKDVHAVISWMKARPSTSWTNLWSDGISTMACGDFTLLRRDAWFRLQGYPELVDMWSPHIDSILMTQAIACGYQQIFWTDAAAYHIDHTKSLSTEPQWQETYPTVELGAVEQCYTHAKHFCATANSMGKGLHPTVTYNGEDWGYPDHEFEEWIP